MSSAPYPLHAAQVLKHVVDNVSNVLFGKREVARLALACLVAGGHLLVEDLPGVGKTTLAKALARSLGLGFRRVQFTADLLPSDLTGAIVLDPQLKRPQFRPGPLFTNLLLAHELNRASAKAQSALLEAMEQHQVSVDGSTYPLPEPFMVIATQNPYDAVGTHMLPHGQRDRFLLRVAIGYPQRHHEDALLASSGKRPPVEALPCVVSGEELQKTMSSVSSVYVSPGERAYVLDITEATRRHPHLTVGASPRAALALLRCAAAMALCSGASFVTPDHVQTAAVPVLGHRLVLAPNAQMAGATGADVVRAVLASVPIPLPAPPDSKSAGSR